MSNKEEEKFALFGAIYFVHNPTIQHISIIDIKPSILLTKFILFDKKLSASKKNVSKI